MEHIGRLGVSDRKDAGAAAAAAEMILEGLWLIAASAAAKSADSMRKSRAKPSSVSAKDRHAPRDGSLISFDFRI